MAISNQNGIEYRGDLEFRVNEVLIRNGVSEDSLEHHGVKGQKWGVIRTPEQLGHEPQGGKDYIAAKGKDPNADEKAARREKIEKAVQSAKRVAKKVTRTIKRKVKKASKERAERAAEKADEKKQKRAIEKEARIAAKAQKSQAKLEKEAKETAAKEAKELEKRAEQAVKERQAYEKQRAKDLATPNSIYKNRKKYSQEEIMDAMKQIRFEQEIQDMKWENVKRGQNKVNQIVGMVTSTADAYNTFVGIYNTFRPEGVDALKPIEMRRAVGKVTTTSTTRTG